MRSVGEATGILTVGQSSVHDTQNEPVGVKWWRLFHLPTTSAPAVTIITHRIITSDAFTQNRHHNSRGASCGVLSQGAGPACVSFTALPAACLDDRLRAL